MMSDCPRLTCGASSAVFAKALGARAAAGRDGLPAECLLLYSYADGHIIKPFIDNKEVDDKRAAQLQLDAMVGFA